MLFSKRIDYTPELTSDTYWDTHHIALVRIDVAGARAAATPVTYRVEEQFTTARMEAQRTAPFGHYWFGHGVVKPPPLAVGDRLVISVGTAGPAPIVALRLPQPADQAPLVRALRRIRALRAGDVAAGALADAAFDADELVAVYALERALAHPPPRQQPARARRLRVLRDDDTHPARARVLASQLAERLEGRPADSAADYEWVSSALTTAREEDWRRLRPFVERLVDFRERRPQTAKLLAATATGAANPRSLRIAAYAAFGHPRLFNYAEPDPPSEELFAAGIELLKDRDELIRRAGAAILHNLSVRIAPRLRGRYVDRARTAIQARARVERNSGVRHHLRTYLGQLEQVAHD